MRQLLPYIPIYPGSENGTQQGDGDDRHAGADLGKQWPRTSAGNRPAKTKQQSSINLPFIELFGMKFNGFTINGPNLEFFDQPYRNHPYYHRTTDDAVHMERL